MEEREKKNGSVLHAVLLFGDLPNMQAHPRQAANQPTEGGAANDMVF